MSKYEELEKLSKLKENGIITEEEFNSEKAKILSNDSANNNENINNDGEILEIKGDFPLIQSKVAIQLADGEKVICQFEATALTGAGATAVNGFLTLTNRRIMFNKKTTGKSFFGTGLLGVALAAGNKDVEIKFTKIASIEAKKVRMQPGGLEIITNDGYSNRYILRHKNESEMIVELISSVINSK